MRSPDNQSGRNAFLGASKEIPTDPKADVGMLGNKAPNSSRQTGDIEDRLRAAGKLGPLDYIKR